MPPPAWASGLALLLSFVDDAQEHRDIPLEQQLKHAIAESDADLSPPAMLMHAYKTLVQNAHATHAMLYRASSVTTNVRLFLKQHFLQLDYAQLSLKDAMLRAAEYMRAHTDNSRGEEEDVADAAKRAGESLRAPDLEALAIYACQKSRALRRRRHSDMPDDTEAPVNPECALQIFYYAVKRDNADLFVCACTACKEETHAYVYDADGTPMLHASHSAMRGAILTDDSGPLVPNIKYSCTFRLGQSARMLCVNADGEGMELVLDKNLDGTVMKHFKLDPVEGSVTGISVNIHGTTGVLSWEDAAKQNSTIQIHLENDELVFS